MSHSSTSWSSILDPGGDGCFFDTASLPDFCPEVDFSAANAWWMSELSRLSYAPFEQRVEVLERIGFREEFFCRVQNAQVALWVESHLPRAGKGCGVLVFKGTSEFREWFTNLDAVPRSWEMGGHVHGGFAKAIDELWGELGPRLRRFDRPVFVTGHSLGAALATLTASLCPAAVSALYTFGSPRVGNADFARSLASVPVYRVVNGTDLVTHLPASWGVAERFKFTHVGQDVLLAAEKASGGIDRAMVASVSASLRKADPPPPLVDHAPCNYCEQLRRQLDSSEEVG